MNSYRRLLGAILGAMLLVGGILSARADDIEMEIQEALKLYQAGDFSGAVGGLEFAAQQIRQQMAGEVSDALPDALPGWEAEDVETAALGGAMLGGGITAGRSYTKDDASVDIEIVGESPMLQMVVTMFNNPMMMSGSGKKLVRIAGNKAAVEYDRGDRYGEIQVVVARSVLVTISGSDVAEEDLKAYAEAVKYDVIEKFADK